MSFPVSDQRDVPVASKRWATYAWRGRAGFCWIGIGVVVLLCTGVLAAGCGGATSGQGVVNLGTTTTATAPSTASTTDSALAFAKCMRGHGEPNFPEPSVKGHSAHLSVHPGSGVDPNTPQFAVANAACKHLLPKDVPTTNQTITAADEAIYVKAAACMRSHGIKNFPDPTFRDSTVTFVAKLPIDTNAPQYRNALTTCQKLIPAGLPYSAGSP